MSNYEFSLRQEVLLEKGADILGALSRFGRRNHIALADANDPINVMYSLVWKAKRNILGAKSEAELDQIESQFDLARRFSPTLRLATMNKPDQSMFLMNDVEYVFQHEP